MEVEFWHWFTLGALLLIVELLAPGIFFVWMAEAAVVTGLLLLAIPTLSWEFQLISFSLFSVISIAVFRKYLRKHPIVSDQPLLNQRTAQYIGRVVTLEQPIVNGQGKIRVDDSLWKVHGADRESGKRVKIVAAEGTVLTVEPVD